MSCRVVSDQCYGMLYYVVSWHTDDYGSSEGGGGGGGGESRAFTASHLTTRHEIVPERGMKERKKGAGWLASWSAETETRRALGLGPRNHSFSRVEDFIFHFTPSVRGCVDGVDGGDDGTINEISCLALYKLKSDIYGRPGNKIMRIMRINNNKQRSPRCGCGCGCEVRAPSKGPADGMDPHPPPIRSVASSEQ